MTVQIPINQKELEDFCRQWKIRQLSFFGSVLREDFGPNSDIDVLASFESDADWSLFDHAQMQKQLASILGRQVDLVSRRAVENSDNWIRKQAILDSAEDVHVA